MSRYQLYRFGHPYCCWDSTKEATIALALTAPSFKGRPWWWLRLLGWHVGPEMPPEAPVIIELPYEEWQRLFGASEAVNHSTSRPTKAEEARFRALKDMGCVACVLDGRTRDTVEPEIHHLLSGNRRIGHDATVPLCAFHHRGIAYDGVPESWFLENVGPSWHLHRRAFRSRYGSDAELLETVNRMLEGK